MKWLFFIVLLIICVVQYCFINGLEKMMFALFFKDHYFSRPLEECKNLRNLRVECLGMPSGHVEIATIIGCFLFSMHYVPLLVLILLIAATCIQRILANRHTFLQTMVGIVFGLFYSFVYLSIHKPYQKILVVFFFIFLYCNILVLKLSYKLKEDIPEWVDHKMITAIHKKRNVPYYLKMISVLSPSAEQDRFLFMSWSDLEFYLDQIIEKITATNIRFDAVVGIKTGGAIISDYLSHKLGIKNYKIKVSNSKYKCNKTPDAFVSNYIDTYIYENDNTYMLCEGIHDNISGKNVILIDELVSSGITMNTSIDYLLSKNVKTVYPVTIMEMLNANPHHKVPLFSIMKLAHANTVWPWGYDN